MTGLATDLGTSGRLGFWTTALGGVATYCGAYLLWGSLVHLLLPRSGWNLLGIGYGTVLLLCGVTMLRGTRATTLASAAALVGLARVAIGVVQGIRVLHTGLLSGVDQEMRGMVLRTAAVGLLGLLPDAALAILFLVWIGAVSKIRADNDQAGTPVGNAMAGPN